MGDLIDMMDYQIVNIWLSVISMIGTFGIGCWMYIERRSDKTNKRVDELARQTDLLDKTVATLAATSGSAPSHTDLAKVYDSINNLSATVNQLVGENRGQSDTLRLILNQITQKGLS